MTARRNQMNQHDALYVAARKYPGGVEALAARMGMAGSVLYKKLRQEVDTNHVTFEEVSEIIDYLEQAHVPYVDQVFSAFCWRHHRIAVRLPDIDTPTDALLTHVLEMLHCEGKLAQDINAALADDGKISKREMERIESDLQRSIEALMVLRQRVIEKHEADCGK